MTTKELEDAISRCRSQDTLQQIVEACRVRQEELRKQAREEAEHAVEQAWDSLRVARENDVAVLFAGGELELPVAEGGKTRACRKRVRLPAGTTLLVHVIQRRAKRVWLRDEATDDCYAMTPRELGLLEVRAYRDSLTAHVALAGRGLLGEAA